MAADNPASNPSVDPAAQDEKARARARLGQMVNNKYRLDAMLGIGGMATVFSATHRNGSRVALKILHSEFARDVGIRDRFLREGYVANRVEHPGRVAILDDDITEQEEPFLVMELLEGETLQQMWKRMGRKIPVCDAMYVAEQTLDTLQAFHDIGIVHRDIKPANIFINKDNVVKLLDFGVARVREAGGDKTRAGTALGTPSFMAPEQAMGLTEGIDGRADVFSIGASLYAILSGQRLHQGRSDNEAFILAATQPAPSLARVAPDLDIDVIALVDRSLAWDPRNRFASAKEMREEAIRLRIEALTTNTGGAPQLGPGGQPLPKPANMPAPAAAAPPPAPAPSGTGFGAPPMQRIEVSGMPAGGAALVQNMAQSGGYPAAGGYGQQAQGYAQQVPPPSPSQPGLGGGTPQPAPYGNPSPGFGAQPGPAARSTIGYGSGPGGGLAPASPYGAPAGQLRDGGAQAFGGGAPQAGYAQRPTGGGRGQMADANGQAVDDPAVGRLVDVFRRIERLLPAVRQYGWTHPETDNKLRVAFQGLVDALREDAGAVQWTLQPYSFMYGQSTVWEPTAPFDVVPYNLFAAGIRAFRVKPGVTDQELRALSEVFLIDPHKDLTPEDDVGSALWERRLTHIQYDVINVFAEGDAADREAFYEEADQIEGLASRASQEKMNRIEAAAMNVQTDQAALAAKRAASQALQLDPVARGAIAAQFETNPERWTERFMDVVSDAFVDTVKRRDVALISEPLDASARDLVLARRFDTLFTMHDALARGVEHAAQRARFKNPRQTRIDFTRSMFSPETVRLLLVEAIRSNQQGVLVGTTQEGKGIDLDWLASVLPNVLAELSGDYVQPLLAVIDTITHEKLRNAVLGFLQGALAGREHEIEARIGAMNIETARPLLRLLAAIKTQGSYDALRRLAQSPNATMKCEAIAFLAQSPDQLRDELVRLTDAPQPELRAAALRAMAFHQVRAAGPLLVKRVQDPSFNQIPIDERKELFVALYQLNAARAEQLAIEIVQKHGLLVDDALEQTRALCADLLGQHSKDMAALEAVLAASKRRWWNTQPLRDAATLAAEAIASRLGRRISPSGDVI